MSKRLRKSRASTTTAIEAMAVRQETTGIESARSARSICEELSNRPYRRLSRSVAATSSPSGAASPVPWLGQTPATEPDQHRAGHGQLFRAGGVGIGRLGRTRYRSGIRVRAARLGADLRR